MLRTKFTTQHRTWALNCLAVRLCRYILNARWLGFKMLPFAPFIYILTTLTFTVSENKLNVSNDHANPVCGNIDKAGPIFSYNWLLDRTIYVHSLRHIKAIQNNDLHFSWRYLIRRSNLHISRRYERLQFENRSPLHSADNTYD